MNILYVYHILSQRITEIVSVLMVTVLLVGMGAVEQQQKESLALADDHPLQEWSGLARCFTHAHTGVWWAINDGGNAAELVLLNENMEYIASQAVAVKNIDWEDIAVANGMIYIADIGNNTRTRTEIYVHAFKEPRRLRKRKKLKPQNTWTLRYPKGQSFDAEAFFVYGNRGWIIDKSIFNGGLWGFDLTGPATQELVKCATVPITAPILAADLSTDGKMLVVAHPFGMVIMSTSFADAAVTPQLKCVHSLPLALSIQREAVSFTEDELAVVWGAEDRRWGIERIPLSDLENKKESELEKSE